jgi:hypothetical protein
MSAYVKSEKARDRCNPIWGNAFLYWLNLAKASKFHQNPIKYRFIGGVPQCQPGSQDPVFFNPHPEAMLRRAKKISPKERLAPF